MEDKLLCCAGLDVHQASVVACVRKIHNGRARHSTKTFGTMQHELKLLAAWLQEQGVSHAALEGTGVYWMPVYAALEATCDLTLCNAQHVKNVPGRKTDVSDAQWLASLLSVGLLRKSFVPPAEVRALRDLTRFRVSLVESHTRAVNQQLKLLESFGIKLATVLSDVRGKTGDALVAALADGIADPAFVDGLVFGRLRSKRAELQAAMATPLSVQQRWLLKIQRQLVLELEQHVRELDEEIAKVSSAQQASLELLKTITGLDTVSASAVLGEIGVDMSAFATAHHLASWAGLCPGQRVSAGKSSGGQVRRGNPYLKRVLVQVAWAAVQTKGSFWREKYYRLKARRGPNRALIAIAHKLLVAIYCVLNERQPFEDRGSHFLDNKQRQRSARSLVERLEQLGYTVELSDRPQTTKSKDSSTLN